MLVSFDNLNAGTSFSFIFFPYEPKIHFQDDNNHIRYSVEVADSMPSVMTVCNNQTVALTGIFIAFLPVILRAGLGYPIFGRNWHQVIFFGISFPCTAVMNFFIILYATVPCLWYFSQLRLARALLSLIAPDKGVGFAWETHQASLARARRPPLPRLDLRQAANAVAWGALWRTLHGRAFCPCVELKLQAYCAICTGVFLISAAVESAASFYESTQGGDSGDDSSRLGMDFKIVSILKLVILAAALVIQVSPFLFITPIIFIMPYVS